MDGNGWIYTWYQKEYQPPSTRNTWGETITHPPRYTDWWAVLNSETGAATTIGGETWFRYSPSGPPGLDPISGTGEIAIGDNKKMFLLHFGGEFHML